MTRPSVTELYRRFAAASTALPLADADRLIQQMQASPAHAELQRFSRDLTAESAALSAKLAAALNESSEGMAHRQRRASRRIGVGSRRWRGMAALAASLIIAVVVWSAHRAAGMHEGRTAQTNSPATPISTSDRIFAGFNENTVASRTAQVRDEIFRAEFLPDEIFNSSKFHDG